MNQTPNWIHRLYLHFYRYKTVLFIIAFMLSLAVIFYGSFYPGEETLMSYVSYLSFLGTITLENPGYHFWITLSVSVALTIFLPLLAIYLGVNILPFSERDGKEYLFSTSKSMTKFLLENSFLVIILMILVSIPSYLLATIFLIINESLETISNITIGFGLNLAMSLIVLFLTAFGSSLTFSKNGGYKLGGGYFVFSFLIDQTRQIEELKLLRDLSIYSQAEASSHSFLGTWNVEFLLLTLILVTILLILTILVLRSKDILEGGPQTKKKEKAIKSSKFLDKLSFIRKPLDVMISKMGWKFPAFRDQLHSSAGVFTIFFFFIAFISAYIVLVFFQGGEAGAPVVLANLDQPMINAGMFNYRYDPTMDALAYFIAIEVLGFGWMSFGPFLLYAVYDLSTRDYRNNYSESTWILPKTGASIIFGRTLAGIFYIILLFGGSLLAILATELILGVYTDLGQTLLGFLAATWAYCVIFVFFVALTFFLHQKRALKTITLGFFFAILIIILGFMGNIEPIIYLSPFGYFDHLGVFLGKITFIDFLPAALIGTALILFLYSYTLKKGISRQDFLA
ncbi:hypothetical protein [Candidatus Hodarchaeum mangrovi]